MADTVSKELILPALRLDVPPRPSEQQLTALAERSNDEWTASPREWTTRLVVRLVVAEVLRSRLAQASQQRNDRPALSSDPEQVTLAQLVAVFRPHVGLAGQAFELAVVEAVNAGVPAATDPMREGLRRLGVTGRDPLKMVALGLEKVPARARSEFWDGVRTSAALTAVVDALAGSWHGSESPRPRDVSGLDRSQLARADALVLGGGRTTPVSFGTRPQEGGRSWLHVPVTLSRRGRGQGGHAGDEPGRRGGPDRVGEKAVEVSLRADSWIEVFETALDAVGSAMQQIDLGSRPRSARLGGLAEALAVRLAAARGRTVADVCASLRVVDPFALELFDHQVSTTAVPIAVPVIDDDHVVQLWLPSSALAGPLFTGAPDLFMGGGADIRLHDGRPSGRAGGKAGPKQGGRPQGKPRGRPEGKPEGGPEGGPEGKSQQRRGRDGARPRRGGQRPATGSPTSPATPSTTSAETPPATPQQQPPPVAPPVAAPQPTEQAPPAAPEPAAPTSD